MKIAIFSDLHGNLPALQTVLDHIVQEQVDDMYCLGDLFVPYPGSRAIWDLITSHQVKCVLGNTEAALLAHYANTHDYISDEVRFRPFLHTALEISPILSEIQQIPANRTLAVTDNLQIHFCHYSPAEVFRGLHLSFQFRLDEYLQQRPEQIIFTGHLHTFEAKDRYGKLVYTVGSAGLPLKGSHQLEYTVMETHNGRVDVSYRLLPYNVNETIDYLLSHNFLSDYGPIGWLAFDEILTQRDRLVTFFKEFVPTQQDTGKDWYALSEEFLRSIGRWEEIQRYMNN